MFGRGGEELAALSNAGIECQVVSGITSGIAVPAAAGIPLTHRKFASGVTFLTGHTCADNDLNWQALAASNTTLVIYMGMTRIAAISKILLDHGMSGQTPAAIIENGTLQNQRAVFTTLEKLAETAEVNALASPSIIVIGQVVSLAVKPDLETTADLQVQENSAQLLESIAKVGSQQS
jgi:uroporphyrin-III C-methyltransferase